MFVIASIAVAAVMAFQFGEMRSWFAPSYRVAIRFQSASGITPATQVHMHGVSIGDVRAVQLDEERGGVIVLVDIRDGFRIPADARPTIVRSLLGDATIDISDGTGTEFAASDAQFQGDVPVDPMAAVGQLSGSVQTSLNAFNQTSREWQHVGRNLNTLIDDNQEQLSAAVAQTTAALGEFRTTMVTANQALSDVSDVLADSEYREGIRTMLTTLPQLVQETRDTIRAVRSTVQNVDRNLAQISDVTAPLAENSREMATRVRNTLANVETLSGELVVFAELLRDDDGSLQQLVSDPELYRNLKSSTASLAVLLRNAEPVVRDMQIFSDKIARHPELIGVSGAIRGSSGIKQPPASQPALKPAAGRNPLRRRVNPGGAASQGRNRR